MAGLNTKWIWEKNLTQLLISWISGVKRDHILDGILFNEEERVLWKILSKVNYILIHVLHKTLVNTIRIFTLKQVKSMFWLYSK